MIGNDVVPRRLDDGLSWIAEVGRRFADATGWPMVFQPIAEAPAHTGSPETCWVSEICDSQGPIGRLQIELPQDPGQDRSFMTVCELSRLVSSLVSRVVSAVDQLEKRNRDVALFLEADAVQDQKTTLQGILGEYLRLCVELSRFRQGAFFLLSADGTELHLRTAHGLRPAEVPVAVRRLELAPPDVAALADGILEVHLDGESAYRRWLPEGARTGLCLPVTGESGPAGSLWLFDRRRRDIDSEELRVIRRMADRFASVLERVVLLRESEIHHRQNRDLQIASLCQRESVVPVQFDDAAFDVAAVCNSRFELGGDLCEVIPLGEGRIFVAVGDASGDSVPAAMVMSAVRGAIRAMLLEDGQPPDLSRLLQRANQTLNGLSATFQFMSLFLGIVDGRDGTLTYSNAGHPPPLLLQRGEIRELKSHGILLGIIPEAGYQSATMPFLPDDLLVAYSDGISEAANDAGRLFGASGISAVLRDDPRDTAAGCLQAVFDRLARFCSRRDDRGDDRTLLVLRRR